MNQKRELLGLPLWLHGAMIVFTLGLWLIVLLFTLLYEATVGVVVRAVDRVMVALVAAVWAVVTAPFRLIAAGWRAIRRGDRASGPVSRRMSDPATTVRGRSVNTEV